MNDTQNAQAKRDAELVKTTLQNPNDYIELVRHYQEPIRRYLRRLGCNNTDDTDDLLQEIFLKVYLNLNDFDPDLTFSSWIYRIAHNETISFFRKRSIRPMPYASEDEVAMLENIADNTNLIRSTEAKMDAATVREALATLEPQYRDVLILKFFEEKSYIEISDILKIPMGTVATLIRRGKEQLKTVLVSKGMNL